jgi:hypothetical protein
MPEYPAYVRYAFSAVRVINAEAYENEAIQAFLDHWGDLSLTTFARVLREGQYEDQQVAIFALSFSESKWVRDLLLPFLHHERPEIRWAAALSLGEMREEAAFPALLEMLQEFLPPHLPVEYDWYDVEHMHVGRILDATLDGELATFLTLVPQLLQEKMGYSSQEAASCLETYADEYFARWESLANG